VNERDAAAAQTRDNGEWLEADGLGGFASGCVDLARTRRYHGLLLAATKPPLGRVLLVPALEVWLERDGQRIALSSQRYECGVVHPDGHARVSSFRSDPWPRWTFDLGAGDVLEYELFVPRGRSCVCLAWRATPALSGARLLVRPLLAARDPHALHVENEALATGFAFEPGGVSWRPYDAWPAIHALANARYRHEPLWFRNFELPEERARGYDAREDLWSPGEIAFDLSSGEAALVLHADVELAEQHAGERDVAQVLAEFRRAELARRGALGSRLERAAESYLVARGSGATVVAGYPWFGDWGRDTFISLRGLCLATGRLGLAESILREWSKHVCDGLLPNRFPDDGGEPEYNTVDAALWFVVVAHELEQACERAGRPLTRVALDELRGATHAILTGYSRGTRHGIGADADGLLRAGEPGVQLTWMDARVDGRVITPRIGKPVEVQALWLNALRLAAAHDRAWQRPFERGLRSFLARFWNDARGSLFDVVDADHVSGLCDASLRPNQLFAAGGLPLQLVSPEQARAIVDVVERELWTPLGPRSLAPGEPGYRGRYCGGPAERDEAYHQGTVWPWLAGAFVEAWVRARGSSAAARRDARDLFLRPMLEQLDAAGLGHVGEVADGDAPHTPGGCPFQAWSVAELLRLERSVLEVESPRRTRTATVSRAARRRS
jgi:predicted glycogen debranching enzyme